MDLKLYFDPIDDSLSDKEFSNDSLIQSVYINKDTMPSLNQMQVAIVGLNETRGCSYLLDTEVKYIREKLYGLKKGAGRCNIIDLGNLRNGLVLEETYKKIQSVCHFLISKNILPVLIGGSQDLNIGQFFAYEAEDKMVSILNVDARIDIDNPKNTEPCNHHIHKIIEYQPNYLFNYNQIGHQSYLVNAHTVDILNQLNFSTTRLGELRENINKVEVLIREADMLTFDLSSIQSIYSPAGSRSEIFGLTGEEACQIMWYAGLNEKLSSLGIYEYNPILDTESKQSAMVVATMIWYFIEGFKNRKQEKRFQTNDYLKYTVAIQLNKMDTIVFYKSKLSNKWWMEVPNSTHTGIYDRNYITPCTPEDYELATKGEIPHRWESTFQKMKRGSV